VFLAEKNSQNQRKHPEESKLMILKEYSIGPDNA
jgi:hypothetical protein